MSERIGEQVKYRSCILSFKKSAKTLENNTGTHPSLRESWYGRNDTNNSLYLSMPADTVVELRTYKATVALVHA